jgi:hypothetical protein
MTPGIQDSFHHSNGISVVEVAVSTTASQEYYGMSPTSSQHRLQQPTQSNGSISSDTDLPPYDLLYALVDLYFKHINPWCPILLRKTTLDSLFGPSNVDQQDRILLHAIVATTLRFSNDARLTDERRNHYHNASKQRVLLYGMENLSVKALQALVILALDLCGSSNGPPGWNIMALITRAVVQLGLAVESNSFSVSPSYTSIYTLRAMILPEPQDFMEEESRRRLFWMVYLLDRYATIATAFEFALDDREVDRTLPCRDDLWLKNKRVDTRWFHAMGNTRHGEQNGSGDVAEPEADRPENLGAFAYYIEILGILSKIHKFLKKPVDISSLSDVEAWQMRYRQLDRMLADWKMGLPEEYRNFSRVYQPGYARTATCGWVMLYATYHTAVIRLHSSAAYPTTRSPIFHPSYSASQQCLGAVDALGVLAKSVSTGEEQAEGGNMNQLLLARLGPPFAFSLWVAARLLLVHGSTVEHRVSSQIHLFVDSLGVMGRWWPVAARYRDLLKRVLDEHQDNSSENGGSVRILADMRRTAFDLDLLISRQPPRRCQQQSYPEDIGSVRPASGEIDASNGVADALSGMTPAPNELEYLDVFDFFNVPRLLPGVNGESGYADAGGGRGVSPHLRPVRDMTRNKNGDNGASMDGSLRPGEFNIGDFAFDAERDWLFK